MSKVAAAVALRVVPITAVADMRGQIVCGIPPDEAVAYVYQARSGAWEYRGMAGNPMHRGHPSAEAALADHAPDGAEYVCDVEIRDNLFTTTARLYRFHRKFIAYGAEVNGEIMDGEFDPRLNILGVADSELRAGEDLTHCVTETREEIPYNDYFYTAATLKTLLTNSCPSWVFVRHCVGPHLYYPYPDDRSSLDQQDPWCVDKFLEPGGSATGATAYLAGLKFLDWDFRWAACAGDRNREPREHTCYFEP